MFVMDRSSTGGLLFFLGVSWSSLSEWQCLASDCGGSVIAIHKRADLTPARKVILAHAALGACGRGQECDCRSRKEEGREGSRGFSPSVCCRQCPGLALCDGLFPGVDHRHQQCPCPVRLCSGGGEDTRLEQVAAVNCPAARAPDSFSPLATSASTISDVRTAGPIVNPLISGHARPTLNAKGICRSGRGILGDSLPAARAQICAGRCSKSGECFAFSCKARGARCLLHTEVGTSGVLQATGWWTLCARTFTRVRFRNAGDVGDHVEPSQWVPSR